MRPPLDPVPRKSVAVLCLPGLGGHPSVFNEYLPLLSGHKLRTIKFVNRERALRDARGIIREEGRVILFCHCYSAQAGIQLAAEMPDKIAGMIFLEPFFSEFQPWLRMLQPLNWLLLFLSRITDRLGLRRRRFGYQPDYVALAKYPIFVQPIFDLRWQDLTNYLDKCWDILTYNLPSRVSTPTTMIFSPSGFIRSATTKKKLQNIFSNARMVEMTKGTHNVITMGGAPVAAVVREALDTSSIGT